MLPVHVLQTVGAFVLRLGAHVSDELPNLLEDLHDKSNHHGQNEQHRKQSIRVAKLDTFAERNTTG